MSYNHNVFLVEEGTGGGEGGLTRAQRDVLSSFTYTENADKLTANRSVFEVLGTESINNVVKFETRDNLIQIGDPTNISTQNKSFGFYKKYLNSNNDVRYSGILFLQVGDSIMMNTFTNVIEEPNDSFEFYGLLTSNYQNNKAYMSCQNLYVKSDQACFITMSFQNVSFVSSVDANGFTIFTSAVNHFKIDNDSKVYFRYYSFPLEITGHNNKFLKLNEGLSTLEFQNIVKADIGDFAHTHPISDITNLQTTLDGKSNTGHTHPISDITNLQTTLDGKSNTGHTHPISDITNLQTTLDGKQPLSAYLTSINQNLSTTSDSTFNSITLSNNHKASQIADTIDTVTITITGSAQAVRVLLDENPFNTTIILPVGTYNLTAFASLIKSNFESDINGITTGGYTFTVTFDSYYVLTISCTKPFGLDWSISGDLYKEFGYNNGSVYSTALSHTSPNASYTTASASILTRRAVESITNTKSNTGHTHPISDITNLQSMLNNTPLYYFLNFQSETRTEILPNTTATMCSLTIPSGFFTLSNSYYRVQASGTLRTYSPSYNLTFKWYDHNSGSYTNLTFPSFTLDTNLISRRFQIVLDIVYRGTGIEILGELTYYDKTGTQSVEGSYAFNETPFNPIDQAYNTRLDLSRSAGAYTDNTVEFRMSTYTISKV